nr:Rab family GTPase [Candidatus Njordarchaeota archaeon]
MKPRQGVFKIVFVGDPGVGKTSLITRYAASTFKENYLPSLGANVVAKEVSVEGRVLTVLVWDIAGQEAFSVVRDRYYNRANIAVIVYDVTARDTLENVNVWLNDLRTYTPSNLSLVLVGNKIDLQNRVVSKEEGEKVAKSVHGIFIETSAKTGENVRKLFEKLIGLLA